MCALSSWKVAGLVPASVDVLIEMSLNSVPYFLYI